MAECDRQLEQCLHQREDRSQGTALPAERRKSRLRKKTGRNAPGFDVRRLLFRMTGIDLPQIDGIEVMTAMTVFSEVGWDMSKWKTENHFVSWLRLCPNNKISGKDRIPTNNRATAALRMSANSLRLSHSYLGAQFRRLRSRLGPPVATKAMAAKLARLVYNILRHGMKYVDKGAEVYESQHRQHQINFLKRKAAMLGLQVTEVSAA